jgi:iron complex transport system substrate-binding protein
VLFILNHGGMTAMAAGQQTGADAAIRAAGLQNAMQGLPAISRCLRKARLPASPIWW